MRAGTLDALDRAIIGALAGNIRRPTQSIAEETGATAATVKRRLDRLQSEGHITLSPLVDLRAAGFEHVLLIGIQVQKVSPYCVVPKLKALPESLTINVTLGNQDIEMVAAARDREAASRLLAVTLPAIEGVASIDTGLCLDVWKFRRGVRKAEEQSPTSPLVGLDPLDYRIIDALRGAARKSNRAIAGEIGVSETAVRNRLSRMQANKQINFENVWRPVGQKDVAAIIGIDVQRGTTPAVCRSLSDIEEVSFVSTTLGRHDIICTINVDELKSLTRILHEQIMPIRGVRSTRPSHCLDQVLHQLELGYII